MTEAGSMRRARWASRLLIALPIFALAACGDSTREPLNLMIVMIDALRADHLGCYGYPRQTSPHIDRLAAEGVRFENFFATMPKTGPSMATFFTGRYPRNHGVTENPKALADAQDTLAEILPAGFRKAAIVGNPTLAAERGHDAGFDEFIPVGEDTETITEEALDWLDRHGSERFFLWVHYLDPHGPYRPPSRLRERFVGDAWFDADRRVALTSSRKQGIDPNYVLGTVPPYQRLGEIDQVDYYVAQYDAEIVHVDEQVGRLLAFLETSGLMQRTIVVLASDHGESLGEHDYYFEHGMLVNEGSIRIPLIVRHPQLEPRVVEDLAQNTDLLPTLLALLDVRHAGPSDGIDLSGLLVGAPGASGRDWVYACTPYPREYRTFYQSIRTADGKLVRSRDEQVVFYDLRSDPEESRPRAAELDDAARETFERLRPLEQRPQNAAEAPPLPEDLRRRLRALGYEE